MPVGDATLTRAPKSWPRSSSDAPGTTPQAAISLPSALLQDTPGQSVGYVTMDPTDGMYDLVVGSVFAM